MDATQPTSLRIPVEIIAAADEIAKSEERSRAQILVRTLREGLLGGKINGAEAIDEKVAAAGPKVRSAGIKNIQAGGKVGNSGTSEAAQPGGVIVVGEGCPRCGGKIEAFYAKFKCMGCGHVYLAGELGK